MMTVLGAIGEGLATLDEGGTVLECWYRSPKLMPQTEKTDRKAAAAGTTPLTTDAAAQCLGAISRHDDARRAVKMIPVRTVIADLQQPPLDTYDAYLRLHLLSHRLVRPREQNLDGMFSLLVNVAWTSLGPCLPERVDALRWHVRSSGESLGVSSVDKIPRMTDYVVPSGVRIADADRVRLGAYLSPGTTVMHEGFCNFNAGTLGTSMVEGRISAGVLVGDGTDIGGGASIMGTLSGGGSQKITIGQSCLLGANSGLGISLGDRCVIEAGCYITAGTQVRLPSGEVVKALRLSGHSDLLFRRHSQTGAVEALARTGSWGGLNPALHTV